MSGNMGEFVFGQFARFSENFLVDSYLADVVQPGGQLRRFDPFLVDSQLSGDLLGIIGDPVTMASGILIFCLNGSRQRHHGLQIPFSDPLIGVCNFLCHGIEGLSQASDFFSPGFLDLYGKVAQAHFNRSIAQSGQRVEEITDNIDCCEASGDGNE